VSTYLFLVSDPELQAFYTGILVAAATALFVMGLQFGHVQRARALSTFVCVFVPVSFALTRAVTHVSFSRLSYAGLGVFLLAVGANKLIRRRYGRWLEKKHAGYWKEFE
jgi:hypothetical protein